MFDPKKLISPKRVLLDALYGNLNKILIKQDNTIVNGVKPDDWYYNTCASVDNVNESGEVVRTNRDVWYDRVNFPEFIDNIKQNYINDGNVKCASIFTSNLLETITEPTVGEIVDSLRHNHGLGISELDVEEIEHHEIISTNTWFGEVYTKTNCHIADGSIAYTAGKLPIKRMVNDAGWDSLLNAFTFTRDWLSNEEVKITLPAVDAVTNSWTIVINDAASLTYGDDKSSWVEFKPKVESSTWEVTLGGRTRVTIDGAASNKAVITLVKGHVNLNARAPNGAVLDYVSLRRVTQYKRGLLRVTAYSTNPSISSFSFKYTVKVNELNTEENYNGFTGYLNCKDDGTEIQVLNGNSTFIIPTGNGALSNHTMGGGYFEVNTISDFTLKASNGEYGRGDYDGLEYFANPNIIIIAERDTVEQELRDAIANNFSDPSSKVIGLGIHPTSTDSIRTMRANGVMLSEALSTAYVPWDAMSVSIRPADNNIVYEVETVENPYGYPESPREYFTGVLCDDLSSYDNPVIILLHLCPNTDPIYRFTYESTDLPLLPNSAQYAGSQTLIAARAASNAIFGKFDLPLVLSNADSFNYEENSANTFIPTNLTGSIGSIAGKHVIGRQEGVIKTYLLNSLASGFNNKLISEVTITVRNIRNVLENYKLILNATDNPEEVRVRVMVNNLTQSDDVVSSNEIGKFEVELCKNNIRLAYGLATMVSNNIAVDNPLVQIQYATAVTIKTTPTGTLPVININNQAIGEL